MIGDFPRRDNSIRARLGVKSIETSPIFLDEGSRRLVLIEETAAERNLIPRTQPRERAGNIVSDSVIHRERNCDQRNKKLPEKHTSQGGKGRRHLSGSDWTQ
jgi:hypothetical protein